MPRNKGLGNVIQEILSMGVGAPYRRNHIFLYYGNKDFHIQ